MIGYIIGLIIVGLIVGALGRLLHPGRDPMGLGVTIAIGIIAMLVAGLLFRGVLGFIVGVLVAIALVALYARFMAPGARRA
jgi:uncharacterized membrane protein YeaQ/YmgE (transglycosylase-associated protein family)